MTNSQIVIAVSLALGQFVFRSLPVVAYLLLTPRVGWRGKITSLFLYVVAVVLLDRVNLPIKAAVVRAIVELGIFACCALLLFHIRGLANIRRARPILFILCLVLFMIAPALLTKDVMALEFATLGFEISFAAYSYAIASQSFRTKAKLRECFFFLLVDPTLVYKYRSKLVSEPGFSWRGLSRCTLGICTLTSQYALTFLLASFGVFNPEVLHPANKPSLFFSYFAVYYLTLYFAHSGLASLQIGIMRFVGYQTPERYHFPWLATGPSDFWNRWNIWLGVWVRQYFFQPLVLLTSRRRATVGRLSSKVVLLWASFLFVGFLHDLACYCGRATSLSRIGWGFTAIFAIFGALVVLAYLVGEMTNAIWEDAYRKAQWTRYISIVFSLILQLVLVWLAMPALTNGSMHALLASLLDNIVSVRS